MITRSIDMIQLIRVIIELVSSGGDWCEDEKGNLSTAIKNVYGEDTDVDMVKMGLGMGTGVDNGNSFMGSSELKLTNLPAGFSTTVQLNECSLSLEESVKSPLKGIFEAISKDNFLREELMGT